MDKMIAYCGTCCTECPAFLATQNNDGQERQRVAELWSKTYKSEIKPQDINCDGCRSEGGRLFSYCGVCEIRSCAQEKGVLNCAYCDDFSCEKLKPVHAFAPEAKTTLDEIKKTL
ncbi:MAG: DUF3795 domain-containing protein [Thermodesulfobacteriota bacterium]|nr:DUF3795 domain-containing protein [Thermodesulfobacteriota bacterium]